MRFLSVMKLNGAVKVLLHFRGGESGVVRCSRRVHPLLEHLTLFRGRIQANPPHSQQRSLDELGFWVPHLRKGRYRRQRIHLPPLRRLLTASSSERRRFFVS